MKRITAHKRSVSVVMAVMMAFHVFGGFRILCANGFLPLVLALGIDRIALAITPPDNDTEVMSVAASHNSDSQGGKSKCCCKKQKKCPAIPRAAITVNPAQRFQEVQFQAKSACCDSLVPEVTDRRLASGGDRTLMELGSLSPFFCSNPLELTSVLLI